MEDQLKIAGSDETGIDGTGQESDQALFTGDTGQLSAEARKVLVQLLRGPAVDGQRHSRLWPWLLRHETVLRSRLSELFLQLVIDRDQQVAFTRQADTDDQDFPRLLNRISLTFSDSVLLLYLREQLTRSATQQDRAVVSTADLLEDLRVYQQTGNTDEALFEKRIHASIEKLKKHNILRKIRNSEDRYEISPSLKLLFSSEKIQMLTRVYQDRLAPENSSEEVIVCPGEELS